MNSKFHKSPHSNRGAMQFRILIYRNDFPPAIWKIIVEALEGIEEQIAMSRQHEELSRKQSYQGLNFDGIAFDEEGVFGSKAPGTATSDLLDILNSRRRTSQEQGAPPPPPPQDEQVAEYIKNIFRDINARNSAQGFADAMNNLGGQNAGPIRFRRRDKYADAWTLLMKEAKVSTYEHSRDSLKTLWRMAAKYSHPDVGGSNERMAAVNTAYALLDGYL